MRVLSAGRCPDECRCSSTSRQGSLVNLSSLMLFVPRLWSQSRLAKADSRSMYSVRKAEFNGSFVPGRSKCNNADPLTPKARSALRTFAGELIGRTWMHPISWYRLAPISSVTEYVP